MNCLKVFSAAIQTLRGDKKPIEHASCQGRAAPLGWRESAPSPAMPDDFRFDVFLSHSSKDKPVVRDIVQAIRFSAIRARNDVAQLGFHWSERA